MASKILAVVFDRDPEFDALKFHEVVTNSPGVTNWWHYIKSLYLLETSKTPDEVSNHIGSFFPGKQHIVFEMSMGRVQGWLPEKAWTWINSRVR